MEKIKIKESRYIEFVEEGVLCGYILITCRDGVWQFHGEKFKKGYIRTALRICVEILNEYSEIYSGCHGANNPVCRLLERLGFVAVGMKDDIMIFRRRK